ncbi:LPD38 domain-containing protein [Ottowia sp. SB7-C50]|uniref:LPD38 domain-containing protein n=1 Tax=Ottowia sp. SB7-C50 TaxID=3081231 RepID=UPI00295304C9|nr:LPD38 domain-containing protein [Ottowia sp. SB7-C50]WOP14589.1 LPD38 domain-containing protein [Ottowia sp. SB7-C50]
MGFIPLSEIDGDTIEAQPSPPAARRGFVPLAELEPQAPAAETGRQPGFVPVAEGGGAAPAPGKPGVLRNILLNNPLTALGEVALNLGSMGVSQPVAGLAGLATEAAHQLGLTDRRGADVVQSVGEALTYQPRGEMGQRGAGIVAYPFEKLAEGAHWAGGKTLDATGSPVAATVVDTAIQALPMVAPGMLGRKAAGRAAPPSPRFDAADYHAYRRTLESGGSATAKNPRSTAYGPDQFTAGTWLRTVEQAKPDWAAGLAPQELLALRADPAKSGQMARALDTSNAAALRSAGVEITNQTMYAAHHFGPDAAVRIARAAPDTPIAELLTAKQLAANQYLRGKTVADTIANWDRRAGRPVARGSEPRGGFVPLDDAQPIPRPPRDASEPRLTGDGPDAMAPELLAPEGLAPDAPPIDLMETKLTPEQRGTYVIAQNLVDNIDTVIADPMRRVDGYRSEAARVRAAADEMAAQGVPDEATSFRAAADALERRAVTTADGVHDGITGTSHVQLLDGNPRYAELMQQPGMTPSLARLTLADETAGPRSAPAWPPEQAPRVTSEVAPERAALSVPDAGDVLPKRGTVNMGPGANYVGLIDDSVTRPGTPGGGMADAGTGGKARAKPIRREDILVPFAKELGTSIYTGRVRGRKTLGTFNTATETVRVKRHADLEVATHEMAHLIDSRVPAVREAWLKGPQAKMINKELRALSYDNGKVYEGFAEFTRLYMTQPDVAAAKAPTFSRWFDDFVQTHKYGPAIQKARQGMGEWFAQDALDRARSKIGDHRPLSDAMDSRWDAFRQAITDDLHGVYRMERELSGGKIAPAGAYESARLARASASMADGALRYGAPVKNADGSGSWKGQGLEEILKPIAGNLDDGLLYFVGKSADELMKQGREHLFTRGEIDAMLSLRTPEFDAAFTKYQQWNGAILDFAEAQGVINAEARAQWQRTQYLPFHRIGQPGQGRVKPGDWSGVKALTGGTENLRDILGNMTSNAAMLIDKAVKNEARMKIAELAERDGAGGGRFMTRIPPESRPTRLPKDAVIDSMAKAMGLDKADPQAKAVIDSLHKTFEDAPGLIEVMQNNTPPAGSNVVAVLKNGKPVWYEVADPILLRALDSIDRPHQPWVMKWLSLPKRIGQTTITLTPDFMIANIARDTIQAGVMSRAGFRPVLDSLKGMRMRLTNDPLYKDFIANGGGLSSIYLEEGRFKTRLERFYKQQGIDMRTVLDAPDKLMGFVETLADAFETSTRLGEYSRAIQAGEHPRHAAYLAREISTDFAMRGDSRALGFMTDTVMFLRPAITSLDRLVRGLAHDPNRGAIATKSGMVALMSSALYLLNKDNPKYQDMPDWDRDGHWHFFVGDQHFRYPKIWEIGAMASLAERSTEAIIKADPQGIGKDFARILAATFNFNYMPQLVAPLYEQATNRNAFTKAPIETPGMEDLQPFLRAKPTTSETLRAAGMATANLPEWAQVNPARSEALLRGFFNTWALYGLQLSDKAFFGDRLPTKRTDELPVLRRFYTDDPPRGTRYETEFYDMLTEAKRLRGTLRELDKLGLSHMADAKEKGPLAGEAGALEHANKELSGINKDMREVRRSEVLTPDEKRERLDDLIRQRNDFIKNAVKQARDAQKQRSQP